MRKIKERLVTLIIFGLSATLLEYAFLRATPDSRYLDMQDITSVQEVYKLGEKPKFRTFAEYHKGGLVTWRDIQYCQYEGEDTVSYYNEYVTSYYNEEPKVVAGESTWNYDIYGPVFPSKCYIKNITTLKLNYGIEKIDTVVSGPYYYGYKF